MMDASLFILLPTGDEVIGLPLTEEGLRDLVAPLMSVKKYARQNGINLRIFFDKDNVKRFKTDVGGVVDKAAYLSKASVILRNLSVPTAPMFRRMLSLKAITTTSVGTP